jgi:hypothetical protein
MTVAQRRLCLSLLLVADVLSAVALVLWLPVIVGHLPSSFRMLVLMAAGSPVILTLALFGGEL